MGSGSSGSSGGGGRGGSSNAGIIVLIVLGSVVGAIIVGLVSWHMYRKRRLALIEANKKNPGVISTV